MDIKPKIDRQKLLQPCCGFFLRGSVKQIAIFNSFLAAANMLIFAAGIAEYWPRHNLEPLAFKRNIRFVFWAYYYGYWASEFYLSLILYQASKTHDVRVCTSWLSIQIICFMIWLLCFGFHCFFLQGFIIILEMVFAVIGVYKAYTFWVVWRFIVYVESNGNFNDLNKRLPDEVLEDFEKGVPEFRTGRRSSDPGENPYNRDFEMDMDELNDPTDWIKIGEGVQSVVYKAIRQKKGSNYPVVVAVKTIRGSNLSIFEAQLRELKIRTFIGNHRNVVELIGACTRDIRDRKLDIVMEFCSFGSLESFLQTRIGMFFSQVDNDGEICRDNVLDSSRSVANLPTLASPECVKTVDLIRWCIQAAKGMAHLHQKKIIHGDVALRNMLLSSEKEVKITDFGFAKRVYNYTRPMSKMKQPRFPILWMAPETFSVPVVFSFKSDIWSFGVAMWEVFSMGDQPHLPSYRFDDVDADQEAFVGQFVRELKAGQIFDRPQFAPVQVYEVMKKCWRLNPEERCTFEEIITDLEAILARFHVRPVTRANSYDPDCNVSHQGVQNQGSSSSTLLAPYVALGAHGAPISEVPNCQQGLEISLHIEDDCAVNAT